MPKVCEVCGKHPVTANAVSHSMRHTKRVQAPNVKRVHALVDGKSVWITACTRCIKSGRVKKAA